ncbi:MAG: hypothetical protein DWQ07_05040 [Chloroflexi bacterium]|nr:MAG: hypothetical protein DWQ07_05040 [Chloroflexota bacterium]MBL1194798.1 hypothetical protein [Chloroflexota bacterium]NOH12090.1 hypothetical protein [Chloroflexota bacterium]
MNLQKTIFIILLTGLLSSCQFSLSSILPQGSGDGDAGVIEPVEAAQADEPTATLENTSTPVPSPTVTATETLVAVTDTPIILPTDTLTPTLTPTITQTLGPEVQLDAFDPREDFGDPDLLDFFTGYDNWNARNDGDVIAQVADGKFQLTAKKAENGTRWVHSWPEIRDYYLEVIAVTPETCEGLDRYGLYFRGPETSAGHIFELSCDGRYRLWIWNGASATTIVNWKAHSAIEKGGGQLNVIAVKSVDDYITMYVNGEEIDHKFSDRYNGKNYVGMSIGTGPTESFTVQFDNFAYWLLEP